MFYRKLLSIWQDFICFHLAGEHQNRWQRPLNGCHFYIIQPDFTLKPIVKPARTERLGSKSGDTPGPNSGPVKAVVFRFVSQFQFVVLLFWFLAILLTPSTSRAAIEEIAEDDSNPWNVTADVIAYDDVKNEYIASGDVVIAKGTTRLEAAYVRFDHKTMKAYAEGDVWLQSEGDRLTGARMEVDLEAKTGSVENGTIFLRENNYHVTAKKINKIGEKTYTAEEVTVTTCDGDDPDWKLTGKHLEVTLEGFGVVRDAALYTKNVPVLYSPIIAFPANRKRQSGLLLPEGGVSTRLGYTYVQPFFWAISDSQDATFYAEYMSKRGIKPGVEYRYILDEKTKGTLMADGFHDKEIDDGTPQETKDWGYPNDNADRTNRSRYWFRMKHDQKLPDGFSGMVDLDVVSDQDYLADFRDGYMGYDHTQKYFIDEFNRGVDDYTESVRLNRVSVSKAWSRYSLGMEARWRDDVVARQNSEFDDTTIQMLPYIDFNAAKQRLFETPLFADLDSHLTYMYSEDATRGFQAELYPRIYLPYRFKNYFSFEPSVGYRMTEWFAVDYQDDSPERFKDENEFRGIFDLKLDLSTELFNVYNLGGSETDALKHSIRPQILYEFVEDKDQDKYPTDLLAEQNRASRLTFALTNYLTAKHGNALEPSADEFGEPMESLLPGDFSYQQMVYLKISQSYDFFEAGENDPLLWDNQKDKRPWAPLKTEFRINPWQYFSMYGDFEWNFYETDFASRNYGITLSDFRGDRLFVEHRNTDNLGDFDEISSESIYADLFVNIYEKLSMNASYERNMLDGKTLRSTLGFVFTEQCWSFDLKAINEPDDFTIQALINLFGLGEFGGSI